MGVKGLALYIIVKGFAMYNGGDLSLSCAARRSKQRVDDVSVAVFRYDLAKVPLKRLSDGLLS